MPNNIYGRDLFNQMLVYSDLKIDEFSNLINLKTGEVLGEIKGAKTYFRDLGGEFEINLRIKNLYRKDKGFIFMQVQQLPKEIKNGRKFKKLSQHRTTERDRSAANAAKLEGRAYRGKGRSPDSNDRG